MNLPTLSRAQSVLLWIVGIVAILVALNGWADDNPYNEHSPGVAALIGAAAIFWALNTKNDA